MLVIKDVLIIRIKVFFNESFYRKKKHWASLIYDKEYFKTVINL